MTTYFEHQKEVLLATYRRAVAEATHKEGLIQEVKRKGPKAIAAALDTANKAAKRRDSYALKLEQMGVSPDEISSSEK